MIATQAERRRPCKIAKGRIAIALCITAHWGVQKPDAGTEPPEAGGTDEDDAAVA